MGYDCLVSFNVQILVLFQDLWNVSLLHLLLNWTNQYGVFSMAFEKM